MNVGSRGSPSPVPCLIALGAALIANAVIILT